MYRDYTDEAPPEPAPKARPPQPGTGTVFVRQVDDTWWASWQATGAVQDFEGTEQEVLAWARARPAQTRLIFSTEHDDYVPL